MTALQTAAQQALEVWDMAESWADLDRAMDALRAALEQPEQEPVALDWLHKWANQDDGEPETQWHEGYEAARRVVQIHLTVPPQRKPLPVDQIYEMYNEPCSDAEMVEFARAIERAHGIE